MWLSTITLPQFLYTYTHLIVYFQCRENTLSMWRINRIFFFCFLFTIYSTTCASNNSIFLMHTTVTSVFCYFVGHPSISFLYFFFFKLTSISFSRVYHFFLLRSLQVFQGIDFINDQFSSHEIAQIFITNSLVSFYSLMV